MFSLTLYVDQRRRSEWQEKSVMNASNGHNLLPIINSSEAAFPRENIQYTVYLDTHNVKI